jgi:hypothetical protein
MVMLAHTVVVIGSARALASSRVFGIVDSEGLEVLADALVAFDGASSAPESGQQKSRVS